MTGSLQDATNPGPLAGEGFVVEEQVGGIISGLEAELKELNAQYAKAIADLRKVETAGGAEERELHTKLQGLVALMEQKGAQLGALRRTHAVLTDEKLATRGALEHAVTVAHRLRKYGSASQRTAE